MKRFVKKSFTGAALPATMCRMHVHFSNQQPAVPASFLVVLTLEKPAACGQQQALVDGSVLRAASASV